MDQLSDPRLGHGTNLHVDEFALWTDYEGRGVREDGVRLPELPFRVQQNWVRNAEFLDERLCPTYAVDAGQVHSDKLHLT